MQKFFKDLWTDEYGKDADLTSVASIIGFVIGIVLYLLSQFVWTMEYVPKFSLAEYAVSYLALIGAIASCQRLKPPAVVPQDKGSEK